MRRLTAKIMAVIVAVIMAVGITPAYAATPSCSYLRISYSDDIEPHTGDYFVMTYRFATGTSKATIKVDASTLEDQLGVIPASRGSYVITDIKYQGTNDVINKQGYACSSSFVSAPRSGSTLTIAIGKKAKSAYLAEDDAAIAIRGTSPDSNTTDTPDEKSPDNAKITINTEAEAKEKTQNKDTGKSNSMLSSLLLEMPLVLITAGLLLGIFLLHKKGKV